MVDQIQNRISEISEKVGLLVQALSALKIENQNLAKELQSKENELTSLSNKHKQDLESTDVIVFLAKSKILYSTSEPILRTSFTNKLRSKQPMIVSMLSST